jgi:hypothetical protein
MSPRRDRVTVDLRGLGEQLHVLATTQGTSSAALVRTSLRALLDNSHSGDAHEIDIGYRAPIGKVVKVTLRLPAAHAFLLARRARAADVSQGDYVVGLLDGAPCVPPSPDHAQAIAALARSTDQLAVISTDLNAFMRLVGRVPRSELERYRAGILTLADDVRRHLAVAASSIAELKPARSRK